ncbi:MAG: HAMP domain-containing histidine kinase, partial [Bdellovibrionales bacterium]|nr:HAMP domain-containing histidine kinase [Bdellovibrionales bacterium]
PETTQIPNGVEISRTRQVWTASHLLLWSPLGAEIQERRSALGWIAAIYSRTDSRSSQPEWLSSQERLIQTVAAHLDHLAVEADLKSQLKIRDQFLSIASHELKTPLTSIYGILQLQDRMMRSLPWPSERGAEQERQLSFLKLVIRQTERMTEMIDGLLDVSRIQAGRFLVEPMVTEVGKCVEEVVAGRLALLAREAGVQIFHEPTNSLTAWVDPMRFEEVVSNLTMNALRMSPEGGVIWIRLRVEGNDLVLSVRDQGQGISAEDRTRVFEPFERAQAVARMGGLGLGLFISRQIARLHGGDVVLLPSIAARGNIFEARFPVKKPLS